MWSKACFFFIFSILGPSLAHAEITNIVINPTQFSREQGFTDLVNFSQITIYGALGGAVDQGACNTRSSASTCNSCSEGDLPCSANRIHPGLRLVVTFQSTVRGQVRLYGGPEAPGAATSEYEQITDFESPAKDTAQGVSGQTNSFSFSVPWSELCAHIGKDGDRTEDTSCNITDTIRGELYFGVDGVPSTTPNATQGSGNLELPASGDDDINTTRRILIVIKGTNDLGTNQAHCQSGETASGNGACNFEAYPGDEKVFIDAIRTTASSFSATEFSAVRVFYGPLDEAIGPQSSFKDYPMAIGTAASGGVIPSDGTPIEGLKNDTEYGFRLATVDVAGNVGLLTPAPDAAQPDTCFDGTLPADQALCHRATPGDVVGLLEKEFDCFIATATYGSSTESHVADFRRFRNKFLHSTALGRKIIRFYYQQSPPLALWIQQNPEWKPAARSLLFPLWLFASACLNAHVFVSFGLLVLLGFVVFRRRLFRRGARS